MQRQIFVARERELEQLDGFLDRALAGQGQVVLATGEAGSGKTTLVLEFARRAQEKHGDLIVAVGQSDAQTGEGDAYLPFREVLGQLTGDVEGKLAQEAISQENASRLRKLLVLSGQALVEVGPDLIGAFVPGAGLATRLGAFVAEKAGWMERLEQLTKRQGDGHLPEETGIDQNNIFEQYTNVLRALAEKQPLLVVLDDLQWADEASISLLFRLGRRIGTSRILLLCTYRPEEVALGRPSAGSGRVERHPLEKVLAELKRYFGDVWVDLDQAREDEGQQFVDAFLETEPNRLGEGFRRALYQHTDGHPLFTVELLRDMQERGDLVRDEQGMWVEGPALDWDDLPARVEGVIEERVGRLERELREALEIGSVEGEDFTAEVVARVQAADARRLVRQLSREVEKQHRLVSARGSRRLGPGGQRLSLYRFHHNLLQKYLYGELDQVERVCLHEDVAVVLEELYGAQVGDIAVQLAHHFVQAGIADKAREYLHRAGEQAGVRYAHQEAERYFSQALALLPEVHDPASRPQEELLERYQLTLAREDLYATMGEREAQRRDLEALCRLVEVLDDDAKRAEVYRRIARHAEMTGDYPQGLKALEVALEAARSAQDLAQEAQAVRGIGYILWRKGEYEQALVQLKRALSLTREVGMGQEEASTLHSLGVVYWRLGKPAEARACAHQTLDLSREVGARHIEDMALMLLGNLNLTEGNYEKARAYYEQNLPINREMGDLRGEAMCLGNLGIVAEIEGDFSGAMERFEQVGTIFHDIGDRSSEARAWAHLGKNATVQGLYDGGREYYEKALAVYREIDNRQAAGWVLQLLSMLLIKVGDLERAAVCSQEALDIAQELGIRSAEASAWQTQANIDAKAGDLPKAAAGYQKALEIRRELDEHNMVVESEAGCAAVALARGDLVRANELVQGILQYLEQTPIEGTDEPLEIYLTCYQVLRALQDPQARKVLEVAQRRLHDQADRITDDAARRSYLENVPVHREIRAEFADMQVEK